ncbi:MAG TPA: serine hydrolase [Microbacteriaceae bacterium]|nr:serine hydrolase [Microbacteriaceae bacterium]
MSSHKNTFLRKFLPSFFLTLGAAITALSFWTKKNNFQSPLFLIRYLSKPHSKVGPLFETRNIRRADVPQEIPEKVKPIEQIVSWKGQYRGLSGVLRETETNTFLATKDGRLVRRWTREGYTEATLQSSWSVAKSVVGLVTGQLIAEGKLKEDTLLVDVLPEYATGGPFDQINVGHLLDMKSGIDVAEEYKEWQAYTGVGGLMTTKDLPAYLTQNRNTFAVPGAVSDYRSVDTQYLSMIISRVEKKPLATIVRQRIWDPIGAVDNASWTLDHADGTEKGFMGLNASARDFLKLGLLIANGGRVGDVQVVPEEFMKRILSSRGMIQSDSHNWGYSSKWWHPTGSNEHKDITALGVYGQFVYVNLTHNVVIAKSSDYGTEQDEDELISVFREISETL